MWLHQSKKLLQPQREETNSRDKFFNSIPLYIIIFLQVHLHLPKHTIGKEVSSGTKNSKNGTQVVEAQAEFFPLLFIQEKGCNLVRLTKGDAIDFLFRDLRGMTSHVRECTRIDFPI